MKNLLIRLSLAFALFPCWIYSQSGSVVIQGYDETTGEPRKIKVTSDGEVKVDATVTATVDTTGLATSTIQTDGSQKTQLVDSTGAEIEATAQYSDGEARGTADGLLMMYDDGTLIQSWGGHVITDPASVVGIRDGAGNALTSAARGSERALSIQLVDASGNQITTFGGTSDSFAAAFPATGTPIGLYSASSGNMVAGQVDASGNMKVSIEAGAITSGTAGAPSADVLTVQGVTGATALTVAPVVGVPFQYAATISDTTDTTIVDGVVDNYIYVTSFSVINADDDVASACAFYNGSAAGTVVNNGYAAFNNGGWAGGNGAGIVFAVTTSGNKLTFKCATTGTAMKVNVRGYVASGVY